MDKSYSTKKVGIVSLIGNIFLLIIKTIIAILTNSQAMIADAFNSAGDILSSCMTFIGSKISSKKPDDTHNLGHGKAEYIYSLLISLLMIMISLTVIKNATSAMFSKTTYTFSIWLIITCIVTIITKFFLYRYSNKIYKKYKNILVKAVSIDHINDCLVTSLNLASIVFSYFKIYYIDSLVGIFISLSIIASSAKLFKESYDVLMDKSLSEETKNKVLEIINKHPEITKINHFNSTPIGYLYQVSLTIFVDGNMTTYESHEIANNLEKEIVEQIEEIYLVVIHVNPI